MNNSHAPKPVTAVAEYILSQYGSMTPLKLHSVLYYIQSWNLAWTGHPMFREQIYAWDCGPVVPELANLIGTRDDIEISELPKH